MQQSKLTPWIPGAEKPVRNGWYLRDFNGEPVRSYFEAPHWYAGEGAFFPSPDQSLPWRGLADDPRPVAQSKTRPGFEGVYFLCEDDCEPD